MTVIYYMSIDRADKPWIGDRRLTELPARQPVSLGPPPAEPGVAQMGMATPPLLLLECIESQPS